MKKVARTRLLTVTAILLLLSSCATQKKIVYFQDLTQDSTFHVERTTSEIRIKPKDKVSILVNSRDAQLQDLFNLPYVSRQLGQTNRINNYSTGYNTLQGVSGYTVDSEGNIDFPVMGKVKIAGLTREECAAYIKNQLIEKSLVKDPVVTVEFMNLTFSVLGEVKTPGRYAIDKDVVTILDAISMAGDLTILGRRENVRVLRSGEDGKESVYVMNLCSGSEIAKSPGYYLQQGDVVYVEPNPMRARQSTVNGNNVLSTSFWISLASLLTSVSILIFNK